MTSEGGVKFTLQDRKGVRSVGALEVLASVIYALIETEGREHTVTLLEDTAAAIRNSEDWTLGQPIELGQVTIN